ncbi:MAG: hypothetical protein CMM01_18695 [Rhodopirellula sp.]|nr:hypothetical protein [Rhodopirellula sp.]OUX49892.1 MAG: hypothetical protein CBE43_08630 [Rhodopirellula sp. TMED283]
MEALGEVYRNWKTTRNDVIVVCGIGKACADARVDSQILELTWASNGHRLALHRSQWRTAAENGLK